MFITSSFPPIYGVNCLCQIRWSLENSRDENTNEKFFKANKHNEAQHKRETETKQIHRVEFSNYATEDFFCFSLVMNMQIARCPFRIQELSQ